MSKVIELLKKAKEICCVAPGDAVDKINQALAELAKQPDLEEEINKAYQKGFVDAKKLCMDIVKEDMPR